MDIYTNYDPVTPNELCNIMGLSGSDKGSSNNNGWHNYTTYYYKLFSPIRNEPLHIFELGLGTNNTALPSNMGANGVPGASLRGWKQFFPNAQIFGADIDRNILFSEERIKTFYCDQMSPKEIASMWSHSDLSEQFDIIIEDGLHTFDANVCFFENSIHKLKKGGVYIIEDVKIHNIQMYLQKINIWKQMYPHLLFNTVIIPHKKNSHDNVLIAIKYV